MLEETTAGTTCRVTANYIPTKNLGSGYSSGSGCKVIHTIRLAQPRDTIVSGK